MRVQGTIIAALQKRSGVSQSSGNAWALQEFVIGRENNRHMVFEVFGEENIAKFQLGQQVDIEVYIDAREYNGRWYNSIRYMAPKTDAQPTASTQPIAQTAPQFTNQNAAPQYAQPQPVNFAQTAQDNDGLPF